MELKIDLTNPQHVQNALGLLNMLAGHTGAVQTAAPVAPVAAPAPAPAPVAPAAPAMAPAPAPAPAPAAPTQPAAPAPAPVAAPAPAAPAAATGVDQATFAAQVQNYAKTHGPKATKAKFAEFGYTKISDVPPEQYAALYAQFQV